MALVAIAEILRGLLGPLVGLGEQHAVGVVGIHGGADRLEYGMGLGEVLAVRALALHEVGDGVETQPIDTHVEPVTHDVEDSLEHLRVVEVEVGLVRVEAVPIERLGLLVPGPVRLLRVEEDDAGVLVLLLRVGPDVEVARLRTRLGHARLLEPWVLVRGVIDDQLGDDADAAVVRGLDEGLEAARGAVGRVDPAVVRDVVTVVTQRRGIERHHPDRGGAELLYVIELLRDPDEIADAVVGRIEEALDVQLVDDRVAVPLRVGAIDHRPPFQSAGGARRQITAERSNGSSAI